MAIFSCIFKVSCKAADEYQGVNSASSNFACIAGSVATRACASSIVSTLKI
ncbi:hypothetical protein [Flavobacterium sp. 81]|uniref:hypothetical protein n=1 Tax=Flavobacterium sp. 81 TaxID=2135621 RepID=UPI001F28A3A5|nr:hypothetical protein [Flavobacterium sp. 81]